MWMRLLSLMMVMMVPVTCCRLRCEVNSLNLRLLCRFSLFWSHWFIYRVFFCSKGVLIMLRGIPGQWQSQSLICRIATYLRHQSVAPIWHLFCSLWWPRRLLSVRPDLPFHRLINVRKDFSHYIRSLPSTFATRTGASPLTVNPNPFELLKKSWSSFDEKLFSKLSRFINIQMDKAN